VLENRNVNDEERIVQLEKELEETIMLGEESDRKFEEVTARAAQVVIRRFECLRPYNALTSYDGRSKYTASQSKTPTQSFSGNFVKYEPILIVLSLLHSAKKLYV